MRLPAVYILTNRPHGVLYTGVTSNLPARIYQHKSNLVAGFTRKYNLHRLVYFETSEDMCSAICREKQIKAGCRANKIALITKSNPEWLDLYDDVCG